MVVHGIASALWEAEAGVCAQPAEFSETLTWGWHCIGLCEGPECKSSSAKKKEKAIVMKDVERGLLCFSLRFRWF